MNIKELKTLTNDLFELSAKRIYIEIVLVALIAWGTTVTFLATDILWLKIVCFFTSTFAFYRGVSFIHEVAHFNKFLPKFNWVYNLLFGFASRAPAYIHTTHQYHHIVSTFGTEKDPEYEKWTDQPAYFLLRPLFTSLIAPFALFIRFSILPVVILFLSDKTNKKIYTNASTLVMNLKYMRPFHELEYKAMKREDLLTFAFFILTSAITFYFGVFWEYLALWYAQIVFGSWCNTYRALVAHRYQAHSKGIKNGLERQLADSVTIEGTFLSELWAPINLRFHSTHHLLPLLPYYNLKTAHYRIKKAVEADHPYMKTIEPNFIQAFMKLYASCKK